MNHFRISRTFNCDVLVVGGGGAAARATLSARQAGADVRMAVKSQWLKSGSTATAFSELLAIAAALAHADDRDTPDVHYADTLDAGRGFIDPELVWILASEAPRRVEDLIALGLKFDRQPNGKLVQGMSDFATYPRTCRANGVTARHILNTLAKHIRQQQIPVDEHIMIFKILSDGKRVTGAIGIDRRTDEFVLYETRSIVLATGGAHHLYEHAVGTPDMTGDGYAMALELGLPLINMEFVQIGPGLIHPSVTLLSGPVWKTSPLLFNDTGVEFLKDSLPHEIVLQDVYRNKAFPFTVSNASFYLDTSIQMQSEHNPTPHGGVWCVMAPDTEELVEAKMPKTKRVLQSKGIEIHRDRFEVGLVVQCMNGGVQMIGPDGETDCEGLFVVGETAGGVRGPDRPGGNSLAEGQVFGHRAGQMSAMYAGENRHRLPLEPLWEEELSSLSGWYLKSKDGTSRMSDAFEKLRKSMQRNCLVIRSESRLAEVWHDLTEMESQLEDGLFHIECVASAIELKHMVRVAKAIVLSARERNESRSCHYRSDFPTRDDAHWTKSIRVVYREGELVTDDLVWAKDRVLEMEERSP